MFVKNRQSNKNKVGQLVGTLEQPCSMKLLKKGWDQNLLYIIKSKIVKVEYLRAKKWKRLKKVKKYLFF